MILHNLFNFHMTKSPKFSCDEVEGLRETLISNSTNILSNSAMEVHFIIQYSRRQNDDSVLRGEMMLRLQLVTFFSGVLADFGF